MLTQRQLDMFIKLHGSYLYHATESEPVFANEISLAENIEKSGLTANDAYHPTPSVYLSTTPEWRSSNHELYGRAVFRINIVDLDPQLIEADEWQLMDVDPKMHGYNGEANELTQDQIDYLKHQDTTWRTLTQTEFQAIAYRGNISPDLLERVEIAPELEKYDNNLDDVSQPILDTSSQIVSDHAPISTSFEIE